MELPFSCRSKEPSRLVVNNKASNQESPMRTLKYAILGLVNRQPMTGYDLTNEFNSNHLANFWYAKHSQVYPELSRLAKEGLLTCEIVIQGEKLEKKLYTITEKGRQELKKWLDEDEPLGPTPKDIFRLRMYFSDFMTEEELRMHLQSQIKKHGDKHLGLVRTMTQNHNNIVPPIGTKEYGDYLVLEGAILRESSYIQWLKNALARMEPS